MLARSGNSQSYDVDFSHVVSLSAFTRNFMLHENFTQTRVVPIIPQKDRIPCLKIAQEGFA